MVLLDILSPRWWKLIIPVLLVMLFFYTVSMGIVLGGIEDRYICELTKTIDIMQDPNAPQERREEAVLESRRITDGIKKDEGYNRIIDSPVFYIFQFLRMIDPLMPIPCEVGDQSPGTISDDCVLFMSKQTYECLTYQASKATPNHDGRPTMSDLIGIPIEYQPLGKESILSNIGFLVLIGYLTSCIGGVIISEARQKLQR